MILIPNDAVKSGYNGYERYDFDFNGRNAVFIPSGAARGKWIWRTEFLGAFDSVDRAMLGRGYDLLYIDVKDMYGSPRAVGLMYGFYTGFILASGLAARGILFGFSRGGLYAVNFAAEHPSSVSALYLDAPVLDLKSWPAGYGSGETDAACLAGCLKEYGMSLDELRAFRGNPIDRAGVIVKRGIPTALVAGDSDDTVPYTENAQRLAEKYRATGVPFLYILKPGCGHHPHSLSDPSPVVSFLVNNALK